MASIDLKDAYYLVPTADEHTKFLRFIWRSQLWQFHCMPNGSALAPEISRSYSYLSWQIYGNNCHTSASFPDDSLLMSDTEAECDENVKATEQLFHSLGFVIHLDKSVLKPTQTMQYLGVNVDSREMTCHCNTRKSKESERHSYQYSKIE